MWFCVLFALMSLLICTAMAAVIEGNGDKSMENLPAVVPKDRIIAAKDFYEKWQEIQNGKDNAVLLDVRTPREYESGHISGSKNVSSDHPSLVLEHWPDRNMEILVYCRTHHRAMGVASFLYRHGYRNIYVLENGILGWAKNGYPLNKLN